MMNFINDSIKKMDVWDMAFTKLAVAFFVIFLVSVWPTLDTFIKTTNAWVFFFGWIIFSIRPMFRFFSRK